MFCFLDVSASLQEALSIGRLVGRAVGPSDGNTFVKIDEKWILNDLDNAGCGKIRDQEGRG